MADESTIVIVTGEGETAADASAESSLVAAGQVAAVTDDATRTGRQWGESAQTSDASGAVDPGDAAILAMFEDKPVTNVRREVIYDYSAASIAAYVAMGAVAYAVYDDGTETQVPWSDVHEPDDEEDEIDDIATAINQHFWHDSNGAHVTDQEQDAWLEEYAEDGHGELASPTTQRPWHNILMNSLGVLIRSGLVDLAALSKSGVTFFDGNGNGSTNVVARFGSGGAQIGSPTSQHAVIDSNGMSVYNADGTLAEINTVDLRAVQAATAQAQADAASAASSASAAASAASAADAKAVQAATAASNAQADATAAAQAASVADGKADAAGQAASTAQASADAASNSLKSVVQGATTVQKAVSVMQTALEAVVDYDPQNDAVQEWFWHDANGAHVLGDSSGYRNDITSNGMDIKQVSTEDTVAHFGADGARIGKAYVSGASDNESHMELDYHSLQLMDKDGNVYFHVSDLRDASGKASITEEFTGDGDTKWFNLAYIATDTEYTVTVSDGSGTQVVKRRDAVAFGTAPTEGATITVEYETDGDDLKAYTLGSRGVGTVGPLSVVAGKDCVASGSYSHAEGHGTTASRYYSHAEGKVTTASGHASHAEGYGTKATAGDSHAEGTGTQATGSISHAEGGGTTASGSCSHAQNYYTIAASSYQTAIGKYNVEDANDAYALIIGNGTADDDRSNALMVDWDGGIYSYGHDSAIGSQLTNYKDNITRSGSAIDTMTLGASLTLSPGTYILFGYWVFNTGSSGTRNIQIALGESSSNFYTRQRIFAAASNWASMTISWPVTLASETTVYVMGSSSKATSSGNLDSSRLTAVRLA